MAQGHTHTSKQLHQLAEEQKPAPNVDTVSSEWIVATSVLETGSQHPGNRGLLSEAGRKDGNHEQTIRGSHGDADMPANNQQLTTEP